MRKVGMIHTQMRTRFVSFRFFSFSHEAETRPRALT